MRRLHCPDPRRLLALALAGGIVVALPGCYTEVVDAKGPGAAAYNNDIRNARNYSGIGFNDKISPPTRVYGPGTMPTVTPGYGQ